MKSKLTLLLVFCLCGCSLPTERPAVDSFVSVPEQRAISLIRAGNDYYLKSRFIQAEIAYQQALSILPNKFNVVQNLLNTQLQTGQLSEAERNYQTIKEKISPVEKSLLAAKIAQAKGEDQLALRLMEDALQKEENLQQMALIYSGIASIAFELGEEQKSLCAAFASYYLVPDQNKLIKLLRIYNARGLKRLPADLVLSASNSNESAVLELLAINRITEDPELRTAVDLQLIDYYRDLAGSLNFSRSNPRASILAAYLAGDDSGIIPSASSAVMGEQGEIPAELALYWPVKVLGDLLAPKPPA